ncbi:unnamed protein product [Rhizoctonia solani]|uniref:F-box domain-containing protein n=1 Tax=Rhizoctonia solani TaxID=456999 RepID=A0A8H3CYF6_9AGAM|nr:unnamed protein product [Rhizoctonia solani]
MSQELHAASHGLQSALDRYFTACSALIATSSFVRTPNASCEIARELGRVTSFERELVRSKAAILVARNSSPLLVPISSLPDEIMLPIFQHILRTDNSDFDIEVNEGRLPQHSLAISQVCLRWRRIALDSRHLWSNINLSSSSLLSRKLMARGEIFASRASGIPLDIRIVEPLTESESDALGFHRLLDQFFVLIESTSIGSLELKFTVRYFGRRLNRVLGRCLEYCVPGKLTQLTLKFQSDRDHLPDVSNDRFLRPNDGKTMGNHVGQRASWSVSLSNPQLDDILSPVTVLKLDKVFPYWTSKAYHGLVELHLISWELATNSIQITEHQPGEIFRSSPALKILHFGIEITPAQTPYPPVQLEDLEELQLQVDGIQSQQAILRLLTPGLKPMQMHIEYEPPQDDEKLPSSTEDELQRFLGRSNITQLFLDSHSLLLDMPAFIQLVPNLEILILRHLRVDAIDPATVLSMYGAPNYPKLHTIHFRFGRVQLDAFRWISDKRNLGLQRMTMAHSVIGDAERVKAYRLEQYTDILQGIFPKIEFINWPEEEFLLEDRDELVEVRYTPISF